MALLVSGVTVELREIVLRNKPAELLALSKKATVPVLVTETGIIDESIDIMHWALGQSDPHSWLSNLDNSQILIRNNDGEFKYWLDCYKYADRHPEQPKQYYRQQGEVTLSLLEMRLQQHIYLCAEHATLTDIALFPFIRQFAGVDAEWFEIAPYPRVRNWLSGFVEHDLFQMVMSKYPPWQSGDKTVRFPTATISE